MFHYNNSDSGVGFVVIIISSLNHIVDSVTWTMCTISELDWEGEERAALRTTYIGTPGHGISQVEYGHFDLVSEKKE
jgi:hypothetical protein